jgi:hypothetical protein
MLSRVHPIIVSSLGAVYKESLSCLKTILKCSDKDLAKLGTWLSEQAIMGSFKLWIDYQKSNEHRHPEVSEIITELNIANQETFPDIEDNDDIEEEGREETRENPITATTNQEISNQNVPLVTDENPLESETPSTHILDVTTQ